MTSLSPESLEYCYITRNEQLQEAALVWSACHSVALDTEFMRTDTFYPRAALFQLAAGEHCYLIDPLTLTDLAPLKALLENPDITKVMHACSEDLEVFSAFLDAQPRAVFDTQIGAAFLGHGLSVGYKNLVDKLFDIELPKGEQRSDWLQRPLTRKQLAYAAQDVTFLLPIYQQQLEMLQQKGYLAWVREEIDLLLKKSQRQFEPAEAYLRIKGANRLSYTQLQVLQPLAQWREIQARQRNIPRGFLLKDAQLLEIAQTQPTSLEQLARIEGIRRRVTRTDGDYIIAQVKDSLENGPDIPALPEPLPPQAKPLIKTLQRELSHIAKAHGLEPEMLLNRKTLVALLTELRTTGQARLPEDLPHWKRALFGDALLDVLAGMQDQLPRARQA